MATRATDLEPSARRVRKRKRRCQEILQAALRAFRDKGYEGTTLEDIAGQLGLRNTALYHYFRDKEAILYECHQRSLDELERVLERAEARFEGAADRLAFLIREHVRVMIDTLEGSTLAFEVSRLSPEHRLEVVRRRDGYERVLREIVSRGVESGDFRPVDPRIATFSILGAINWIARWYDPEGSLGAPELGVRFADHLVGGLLRAPERAGGTSPERGGEPS